MKLLEKVEYCRIRGTCGCMRLVYLDKLIERWSCSRCGCWHSACKLNVLDVDVNARTCAQAFGERLSKRIL